MFITVNFYLKTRRAGQNIVNKKKVEKLTSTCNGKNSKKETVRNENKMAEKGKSLYISKKKRKFILNTKILKKKKRKRTG